MSMTYPKTWKQCATCSFWCGARECDNWGDNVKVESGNVQGKCAIPSGGWKGQQRQASSSCTDWKKWPALK